MCVFWESFAIRPFNTPQLADNLQSQQVYQGSESKRSLKYSDQHTKGQTEGSNDQNDYIHHVSVHCHVVARHLANRILLHQHHSSRRWFGDCEPHQRRSVLLPSAQLFHTLLLE